MDSYTLHLLWMAYEACQQHEGITVWTEVRLSDNADVVFVECNTERGCHQFNSDDSGTLADALAALLRDLNVEVPDRPSEARVEYLAGAMGAGSVHRWRSRFASEPQNVLALLEGGGS